MHRLRRFYPFCLLVVGMVLLSIRYLELPSVSADGGECTAVRLYPLGTLGSPKVEAWHEDNHLVVTALVGLEIRDRLESAKTSFDLLLFNEGSEDDPLMKIEGATAKLSLPSKSASSGEDDPIMELEAAMLSAVEAGVEVLLLADVNPRFLTVPPDSAESPYHYLALVLQGLVSHFDFSASPTSDRGRLGMPPSARAGPTRTGDLLYCDFLSALPQLAEMSPAEAIDRREGIWRTWLNEEAQRPRMAVVLRWQEDAVVLDEYDFGNEKGVPILVVDIGQPSSNPRPLDTEGVNGAVMPLGFTPERMTGSWPHPDHPEWPGFFEERVPAKTETDTHTIWEHRQRVQDAYRLRLERPGLLDSHEISGLKLKVSTWVGGHQESCSDYVHFLSDKEHGSGPLRRFTIVVSWGTGIAATFVLGIYLFWPIHKYWDKLREILDELLGMKPGKQPEKGD